MRNKLILCLTIYFSSCIQPKARVTIFKSNDLYIIDTSENPSKFLQFDVHSSDYPIYYIGPKLDTIKIGKQYWRGRTKWTNDFVTPQSRSYSDKILDIFVDTSIRANSSVEYLSDNVQIVKDSTENFNSFLFFLNNVSDSSIYLGRTFSLYFINREAKDLDGKWIKIDKKLSELGVCGAGEPTITLKPNEIVISKIKRYKGSFVTDFRLVFGHDNQIVYSNIFRDSIDKRTLQNYSAPE